jgi:multicomponent Na+:H+ antiporter subunit B
MIGRRSVILTEADRWLFPVVLLVSVYITFRGHNAPGGGFIGGLIAGAAFIIRYLAGTPLTNRRHRALNPTTYVGVGLSIAVATALVPLAYGDALLESAIWKWDVPAIGEVKLVSSSIFDIGVYFLVIGVVLLSLISLGADPIHDDEVQGEL